MTMRKADVEANERASKRYKLLVEGTVTLISAEFVSSLLSLLLTITG